MLIVAPAEGFDSLVSVAEADDYMTKFGHEWGSDTGKQEIALRVGSQYILNRYRVKAGYLDPVHSQIKHATCEAAIRAFTGSLFEDVAAEFVTRETVGPITVEKAQTGRTQKRFGVIDALMMGMTTGMNQIKLVRG